MMIYRTIRLAVFLSLLFVPVQLLAQNPPTQINLEGFDAFVEKVMKDWKVPGLSLAIVKDGKIVYAKGYGFRDVVKKLPVTPDTLFAIGSNSKSFTAAALGILADDGKLDFDKPVREYLPDFRLHDEYATANLRVRDLVSHQSGLPRHDLLWYGSPLSRKELFDRLRYLEPSRKLHEKFQYNNLMFMAAGVLVERLSGMTWEEFIAKRIFEPLAMKTSNTSVNTSKRSADFSLPYADTKGEMKEIPFRNIDAIGPAGSINSSVNEMSNWLAMQMAKGKFNDKQVISEKSLAENHKPHILTSDQLSPYEEMTYGSYAMGWSVSSYRGHLFRSHSGGIDGFISQMWVLPKDQLGVVVLTNSGTNASGVVVYNVLDRAFGLNEIDWNQRTKADLLKASGAQIKARADDEAARKKDTQPSHPLADYVGEFEHPGYGKLLVTLEGDALKVDLHGLGAKLKHHHYDVFQGIADSASMGAGAFVGLKVNFLVNKAGQVDRVTLPLEPAVKEIVFTRKVKPKISEAGSN